MKNFYFIFLFVCLPFLCFSEECKASFRTAYFYPTSDIVRKTYHNGGLDLGWEASVGFCENWAVFGSVNWYQQMGRSTGLENHTRINMIPLGLGVKYLYPLNCWCDNLDVYLGAGLTYSFLYIHDQSEFVKEKNHESNIGGVIKSGINYLFYDCYFLDLFMDYQIQHFRQIHTDKVVDKHSLNLSGFKFGAGLGVAF